jgi:hypothetical protein
MFGKPSSTASNGVTGMAANWNYNASTIDGKNLIPFVGPYIAKNESSGTIVTLSFDKDGKLTNKRRAETGAQSGWAH